MKKYYKIIDYGTIITIAILVILVLFKLVPDNWFITILIAGLMLLVVRIIFRAYFIFQQKKQKSGE